MSIYDLYESDSKAEIEGVWIDTISTPEKFKLASASNSKYSDKIAELTKPKLLQVQAAQAKLAKGQRIPEDILVFVSENELIAFCECILVDWKGVKNKKGKNIPYSPAGALKLLTNPDMRRLKEALMDEADNQNNFAKEQEQVAEKN